MTRSNILLLVIFLALFGIWYLGEERASSRAVAPSIALELFPDFDPIDADRILINSSRAQIALARSEDSWVMSTSGDYPAKSEKVDQLLDKVARFKKGNVASRNPESFASLRVDGSHKEVLVFGEENQVLAHFYVGKSGPGNQSTFVRKEGAEEVLAILDREINSVFNPSNFAWFENLDLLSFDHKLVEKIEVDNRGELIVLERNEVGDWVATAPLEIGVDQKMVTGMARLLGQLRFFDVVSGDDEEEFGLVDPEFEIRVDLADETSHAIRVGSKTGDGNHRYLRKEGSPYVYLIGTQQFDSAFNKTAYDFLENKEGADTSPEKRVFSGPEMGPALIQALMSSDLVIRGVAEESAVSEDGSPIRVETGEEVEWITVPFQVREVFLGKEDIPESHDPEAESILVELPAKRKLPNLLPANGSHVLFLNVGESEGTFRLKGDPVDTLIQPEHQTLEGIRQVSQQMIAAREAKKAQEAAEKEKPGTPEEPE